MLVVNLIGSVGLATILAMQVPISVSVRFPLEGPVAIAACNHRASLTASLMPSGGRGPREVFDSPWGSRQYRTKSYVREHTETGTP